MVYQQRHRLPLHSDTAHSKKLPMSPRLLAKHMAIQPPIDRRQKRGGDKFITLAEAREMIELDVLENAVERKLVMF